MEVFQSRMDDLEEGPGDLVTPPGTEDTNSCTSTEAISLTSETAFLLQTYTRTVATWMDLFDFGSTYQLRVPQFVLSSPLLFHCVCAFTSNYLALSVQTKNASWKFVAVKHYGEALRLLIEALSLPSHEHALTASMLLLSYEIQEAQNSEDYRRHFLGLSALIRSRGITPLCADPTDRANFWIYVRHEIALAMSSGKPLVLDPSKWTVSWIEGETREDVLGNHVIWILARVLNTVYGHEGNGAASKETRLAYLNELEVWRAGLSDTFVGIPYGETDDDGFRRVFFPVTAAAASAFWYHVTHILLYAEPVLQDDAYAPLVKDQATKITNIAISEFPAALKVFSTYGLFFGELDTQAHQAASSAHMTDVRSCEAHSGNFSQGAHLECAQERRG